MEGNLFTAATVADSALAAFTDKPASKVNDESYVILAIEQVAAYAALGDHDRTRRLTTKLLQKSTPNIDPSVRSAAFAAAAQAAAMRGDTDAARAWAARTNRGTADTNSLPAVPPLSYYGSLQEHGDGDAIRDAVATHDAILAQRGLHRGSATTRLILRARAQMMSGDVDDALNSCERLIRSLSGAEPAAVRGQALAVAGEVLAADGQHRRAAAVLGDAAQLLHSAGLTTEARAVRQRRSSLTAPADVASVRAVIPEVFAALRSGERTPESAIYTLPPTAGQNTPVSRREQRR